MKRFLRVASVFFLGLLVLDGIVLAVIAPIGGNADYLGRVQDIPSTTKGIVLGDSHATRLNDAMLAEARIANLSMGSDSYEDMLNKLKYALAHYPIETVLISADRHGLSKYREYTNNLDKSALLSGKNGFKSAVRSVVPLLDARSRDLFKGTVMAATKRLWDPRPTETTAESPTAWQDAPDRAAQAEKRYDTQFRFGKASPTLEKALKEIAVTCKAAGVRLVGLKYPLADEYLDLLQEKDYGAAALLRNMEVPVLDHETLFRGHTEFFEDEDHVNPDGSLIFTGLVLDELRRMGHSF